MCGATGSEIVVESRYEDGHILVHHTYFPSLKLSQIYSNTSKARMRLYQKGLPTSLWDSKDKALARTIGSGTLHFKGRR